MGWVHGPMVRAPAPRCSIDVGDGARAGPPAPWGKGRAEWANILKAFAVVVIGIGLAVACLVLGALYAVSTRLPRAMARARRSGRCSWGRHIVLLVIGLIDPGDQDHGQCLLRRHAGPEVRRLRELRRRSSRAPTSAPRSSTPCCGWSSARLVQHGVRSDHRPLRRQDEAARPIAKALIFMPSAIALVGAGLIWKFVYSGGEHEPTGLLNAGDPPGSTCRGAGARAGCGCSTTASG